MTFTFPVYITITAPTKAEARAALEGSLNLDRWRMRDAITRDKIVLRPGMPMSYAIDRAIPGEWNPAQERSLEQKISDKRRALEKESGDATKSADNTSK
jgi:hypothetical protein